MLTKKKNKAQVIPSDLFFYSIPLDEGRLKLTKPMLEKHFIGKRTRKLHYGNEVIITAYSRGIVTVHTRLHEQVACSVYVHAEPEEVHVGCSCGMPDKTLCAHAYIALHNLILFSDMGLAKFYWPGYDVNEQVQDKFLDVDLKERYSVIRAKPQFGMLFKPGYSLSVSNAHLLPKGADVPNDVLKGERDVLGFGMLYGAFERNLCELPVLLPLGLRTSKDNRTMTGFEQITDNVNFGKTNVTDRQLELRSIAEDMQLLREPLGFWEYDADRERDRALKKTLLLYWERRCRC